MADYKVDTSSFSQLKDKSVVISGGATGIGAATVRLLAQAGARVVIGDVKEQAAQELIEECQSQYNNPNISFENCDVRVWQDIYSLFRVALDKHSRIDHCISCAGIFEQGDWYDPELTIQGIGEDAESGDSAVLDVNVLGSARFSRAAVIFMREEDDGFKPSSDARNKSLTLMSSVNAFRESPGLTLYQASKHAIQGIMRASRKPVYERHNIRVNCICPGVTDTPMTEKIVGKFKEEGLYWQSAEAVGKYILQVLADSKLQGKSIYVEGGDGWEFEDSFYDTQEQWLGKEGTRRMRANTEAVQKGALTGGQK